MPDSSQFLVGSFANRFLVSTGTFAANSAYLSKVEPIITPVRVTIAHVHVIITNGNIDVGIFELSGAQMIPLATAGSTATGGANTNQALTLSNPVWLLPDHTYYVGLAIDNNVATFTGLSGEVNSASHVAAMGLSYAYAASFPLPTIPFAVGTTGYKAAVGIWLD